MPRPIALAPLALLLVIVWAPVVVPAAPTVVITEPMAGTVLTDDEVLLRGTAQGSDARWYQEGALDFAAGTCNGVVLSSEVIVLDNQIADDFGDNSLDTARWDIYQTGGITTVEEGNALHQSGRQNAVDYWTGRTHVITKQPAGSMFEAHLAACSGTGSGWIAYINFFQDDANQVTIGLNYDPPAWGSGIWVAYGVVEGGVQTTGALSLAVGTSHTFKLVQRSGVLDMYMDGSVQKSVDISLTSAKAKMGAVTRYSGDTIDVQWDDFRSGLRASGSYMSDVYDTRAVDPILRRVDWNATTSSGTGVRLDVRSCDASDMAAPTEWTAVANGQATGLPSAKRYIQYRATLTGDGISTPELRNVTVSYHKPVRRVEVSVDDQMTWTMASGTTSWTASLVLPDGTSTIWVRVTDVSGDTSTTSLALDVDTTPPWGSVVINDGDEMTSSRTVSLRLTASDRYGVAEMMVSEAPTFAGARWASYEPESSLMFTPGDGTRTVYAKFRDRNGWTSTPVNDTIILDTTPPWGSIHIDDDAEFTNTTGVELWLDAGDMSGVTEMRVGNSSDILSQPWRPFSRGLGWQLPSGDGIKAVHAAFRDPLGHESVVVSDSIVLDTTAPIGHIDIDGGAVYTTTTEVMLTLTFEEANRVAAMLVEEESAPPTASWEPPAASRGFTTSDGDGTKTVHMRARDAAGNVGEVARDTIVLDSVAPTVIMGELPRKSPTPSFDAKWMASDATSGVAACDLQHRDGDGAWTDWLNATDATNATFEGADGHTYTFRARARDLAGNLGSYSESTPIRVLVPIVSVTVDEPPALARVSDRTTFRGTASHTDPEIGVLRVEVSLDGGTWQPATGTTAWAFALDVGDLPDGEHALRARATDGERWSGETSVTFIVDNPEPRAALSSWLLIILIVALVAAAIAAYVWRRSRALQGG